MHLLVYIVLLYCNAPCKKHKIRNVHCNLYVQVRSLKDVLNFSESHLNYKIYHQLVTEFRQKRFKQEVKYYVLNKRYFFQQQNNYITEYFHKKKVALSAACHCYQMHTKFVQHYFLTFPSKLENYSDNQCGFQRTISATGKMSCIRHDSEQKMVEYTNYLRNSRKAITQFQFSHKISVCLVQRWN